MSLDEVRRWNRLYFWNSNDWKDKVNYPHINPNDTHCTLMEQIMITGKCIACNYQAVCARCKRVVR